MEKIKKNTIENENNSVEKMNYHWSIQLLRTNGPIPESDVIRRKLESQT